ncbi:MAG: mercury methylation ferredoxin HgcB [Bacteroidales bacterium]|nr:mercury methylation ferredoxin HgcB [Bacteroidales bacterium]
MFGLTYLKNVVTLEHNTQKCTACKMCMNVCPHEVFQFKEKKVFIAHKDLCMECGACAKNCPEGAIRVKTGVGCAAGIINSLIKGTEPSCDCSNASGSCC